MLPLPAYVAVGATPIQHVVIIVQMGQTLSSLFNGYPGANTVTTDPYTGKVLTTRTIAESNCNPAHTYVGFQTDWANGAMTGFNPGGGSGCVTGTAYSYVQSADTAPYWTLAESGGLAANALQPNEGPAGPAHQFLIAGQAGYPDALSENAPLSGGGEGPADFSCADLTTQIPLIDMRTAYPAAQTTTGPACETYPTILDELETAGFTWNYYGSNSAVDLTSLQQWIAPNVSSQIYNTPAREAHVIYPETTFLTDVAAGTLASVTYVSPSGENSDAAGHTTGGGPAWVTSVVSAVQASKFWNSTAIFITWADWGGWYDNVCGGPSTALTTLYSGSPNPYVYGCRVPIIVVSPFAKPGYVNTTRRSYVSILRFVETVFALPSLGTLDKYEPDDMTVFFDWWRGNRRWL